MSVTRIEESTHLQEHNAVAEALRPAVEDFLRGDSSKEIDIEAFLAEEKNKFIYRNHKTSQEHV